MLAVLGREALAPRLSGPRELSRLTGLLPLVVLPSPRWRPRPRQAVEAYQTLAAVVRLQLSDDRRVVLVTSAHREEERSTVAEGLARALADGGVPTLLVAADLRHPTLHERLGVPQAPGLAEVLNALEQGGDDDAADVIRASVHEPRPDSGGRLRVLPSGTTSRHPAALLSGDALGVLFDALARSRYRLVIVEGPPLRGAVDGQLLARVADALLVVCRLDRLVAGRCHGAGGACSHASTLPALGAVVIGGARASYSRGRGAARSRGRRRARAVAAHRARPDQGGHDPQVPPVQRVDEEAVDEQPAPRAEQRHRADAVGTPAAQWRFAPPPRA